MNSIKENVHNFFKRNFFILLVFIFISMVTGVLFLHSKFVIGTTDLYFHWQRILDLKSAISHGDFYPSLALDKINQTGSAVMSMYPKANLYPIVLLSYFFNDFTKLIPIIFVLRNLLSFLISYYSCYSYNKNRKVSFLFSISYTLTPLLLFYGVQGYDIGVSSSMIFMPLILFGFLGLLKNNDWIELTIGMSCIILCHILNSVIIVCFLSVFMIFNVKKFMDKSKIKSLCKAVFNTVMITSVFFIPFLILNLNNKISLPENTWLLNGTDVQTLFFSSLNNIVSTASVSVTGVLGLVVSILLYKRLNLYSKQLLLISIIFILICTNIFPWSILEHTFIKDALQFPTRLYVIPQLLLNLLFAENIFKVFDKKVNSVIVLTVSIFIILLMHLGSQKQMINANRYNDPLNKPFWWHNNFVIKSNSDFYNLANSSAQIQDYYPRATLNSSYVLNNHLATYDNNKKISFVLKGNGKYNFKSNIHVKRLTIPFIYYNGMTYNVRLDGKSINYGHNNNSLMTIDNITSGNHVLIIIVKKTGLEIFSYFLFLIGILILITGIFKKYFKTI